MTPRSMMTPIAPVTRKAAGTENIIDLVLYDRLSEVSVYRGGPGGPGGAPAQVLTVDADSYTTQTGDLDGDGRDDLLVLRTDQTDSFYFTLDRVDVHLAGPDGLAATPAVTLAEEDYVGDIENNFGSQLSTADFDRDGRLDLAVASTPPYPTPFFSTRRSDVFVFAGDPAGVRTTPAPSLSGIPGFGAGVAAGPPQAR